MAEVKKKNIIGILLLSFLYPLMYFLIQVVVSFFYGVFLGIGYYKTYGLDKIQDGTELSQYITENMNTNILLIISIFITIAILLIIMLAKKKTFKEYFSINKIDKKLIPLFILLGISFDLIVIGALNLINEISNLNQIMQEYSAKSMELFNNTNMIFSIIIIGIFVPILEEMAYRVLPINKLMPRVSSIMAIILTSIVFAISHGQIVWIIYTFIFGVILSTVYIKYKSSIANILIHSSFNLTTLILMVLPIEAGNILKASIIILIIGVVIVIPTCILLKTMKNKKESIDIMEDKEK